MKIKLQNITKTYSLKTNFEKIALKNVTFEINQNEVVGIIGPNGSGKSTLSLLLSALSKQSEGIIQFDNLEYNGKRKQALSIRKQIGVTFQNPETQILKSNLIEEIGLSAKVNKDKQWKSKAEQLAEFVGFTKDDITKTTYVYSQGNKRKTIIAASTILNPSLLILDEPTNNLDATSRREVIELIKKIKNNKTVIIISHDLDLIWELTDKTILLNDGVVVAIDKTTHLLSNKNILDENSLIMPKIPSIANRLKITTSSKTIEDFAKELYARV